MIKVLYLDTNSIIKYFVREDGSDFIKWLIDNHISYSISLNTSQTTFYEFKIAIKNKEKRGEISNEQLRGIILKSKSFLKIFRIPDSRFNSIKKINYNEICSKYKLKINKNSRDARHLACVINYLHQFRDKSKARVITADIPFGKIIKKEGYEVINPEKIKEHEFLKFI